MDEDFENISLEEDFYQLLNVSRTATDDEINSAYRRSCLMFHPDKHGDNASKQKWAVQIFGKIKEAYEVLSNPQKRAVYDTLGKKGLEVEGWELIFRTRTPKEIREEYERLKQEKEERRLRQTANPRGSITLSVNATDMFMRYVDKFEISDENSPVPNVEVSSITINQAIDAPVTLRDTVTISGNISTQNGVGGGSVNISNRHLSSEKAWTECDFGIGNGPNVGFKMFRNLTKYIYLNCGTVMRFTSRGLEPSFISTLAMQFNAHSVGYLTYKAGGGTGSSMTTLYVHNFEKVETSSAVEIGHRQSFIALNLAYKFPKYDTKLKCSTRLGTFGVMGEYGIELKVSQNNKVAANVSFGIPVGVMLKLKWVCGTQSFIIPIHVAEEVVPQAVFYATIMPVISWLAFKKFVLDPVKQERAQRERQRCMETHYERLQELQKEARATIELMKESYARIVNEEKNRRGLVITKALYGKEKTDNNDISYYLEAEELPPEIIDVTIPIQCLVRNSRLELMEADKAALPGFYDPSIGDEKKLIVSYSYRNKTHRCQISEKESLVLPRPCDRSARS